MVTIASARARASESRKASCRLFGARGPMRSTRAAPPASRHTEATCSTRPARAGSSPSSSRPSAATSAGVRTSSGNTRVCYSDAMSEPRPKLSQGTIPTSLAPDAIVAEANAKAGRSRFDDESFREPLARLLDSLDREAGLSAVGRATQHARIVESLVMRHVLEQHEARHPEIRAEAIAAPLVIVGLARTGTTMLHRLLSADPGPLLRALVGGALPRAVPGLRRRCAPDPRIAEARAQVQWILAARSRCSPRSIPGTPRAPTKRSC